MQGRLPYLIQPMVNAKKHLKAELDISGIGKYNCKNKKDIMMRTAFLSSFFYCMLLICFFLLPAASSAVPLSAADAVKTALNHAKVQEQELKHIKIEQEYDDGILQYEIEFWKEHVEYEYKINVNTGEIMEYGQERNRTSFTPASPNQEFLTTEQIKQIAVSHAGLDIAKTRFVKIAQEFNYGYSSYELKFWHEYIKYKYEIDAASGEILEFSVKNYQ